MSSIKYLGLNIDENVNWNIHIKKIKEQLIKLASSFKLIKHYIPYNCKRQLYYAYVYSNVIYCIETYGHTSKSNINQLQIIQNRILKILFNKDWYTSSKIIHKDLKMLQINDICNLCILKLVYKQQNDLLPEIFNEFFTHRNEIHSINTRNSHKIESNTYKKQLWKENI